MAKAEKKPSKQPEERVAIPLDPETALRALLKVDPAPPKPAPRARDKSGG
jgi:hypothetical protein